MNCVKCGAALEEGSTSTLCPACQALETPIQEEKPAEPAAPAEPTAPAETPEITMPDVESVPTPPPAEDTPEPPAEEPTPPSDEVPGGTL